MLARLFRWWIGELAALARPLTGARSSPRLNTLELLVTDTEIVVTSNVRGRVSALATLPAQSDDENRHARTNVIDTLLVSLERSLPARKTRITVKIAERHRLVKTVELPLATEENLSDVLAHEMDRLTPFKSESVYFQGRVVNRDRERKTLEVALSVVPRARVDGALALLTSWDEVSSQRAVTVDGSGPHTIVDMAPPAMGSRRLITANLVLLTTIVALGATLVGTVTLQQYRLVKSLRAQVEEAQPMATQSSSLRSRMTQLDAEVASLVGRKTSALPVVILLEALTARIPDGTWLQRLVVHRDRVQIIGISIAATSLVQALEASDLFANAHFVSSVTRDDRTGGERFHLVAQYRNQAVSP